MSWPEAVQRVTAVPAQRIGLKGRGLIKAGYAADLVVFDPASIKDQENYINSAQAPLGISYVFVDGVLTKAGEQVENTYPGTFLAKS